MILIKLESIELKGFKSFANKTTIKFDKQITAIVGPNGSGKSNISDAIRWVLGEQSAKSLRGAKMNDVIFQGGENKNSLNLAEVSLNFKNTDHALDIEYDNVVISRRIYRDGENEYKINGKKVRLKDVRELFLDTGIGKEGYSLIGQGRIEEIISSSNLERRALFEEASGISKHKYRRDEASKRLSKVTDDLEIIEREWEYKAKDLKKLEAYAENFNKWEKLTGDLESMSLHYYKNKSVSISADIKDLDKKIKNLNQTLGLSEKEYNTLNKNLNPIKDEIEEIETILNDIEAKISRLERSIESKKNNIDLNTQKLLYNSKDLTRAKENLTSYENNLRDSKNDLENESKKQEDLISEIEKEKTSLSELLEKKENLASENDELAEQIEILKEKKSLVDEEIQNHEINLRSKELFEKRRQEDIKASQEKLKSLEAEISSISQNLDELSKNKIAIINSIDQVSNDINSKNEEIREFANKLDDSKNKLSRINVDLKTAINQYKFNKEAYERNEGYFYSVSDFLNKTKSAKLNHLYVDTLANLIKVNPGYEEVIDNLMGAGLQNIVTQNKNDTRDLINFVNKNRIGRITFLPIDSVSGTMKNRPNEPEVMDMAYELIDFEDRLSNIIYHFLGSTVVTKTIDDAISLSNKIKGYRIITMNLDVINSWGSMVAGSNKNAKNHTGILNRSAKLETSRQEITNLKKDYEFLENNIKNLNKNIELSSNNLADIEANFKHLNDKHNQINSEIANLTYRLENLNRQRDEIVGSLDTSDDGFEIKDIKTLRDQSLKINTKLNEAIEKHDSNNKELTSLISLISKKENNIEILNRDLNMIKNSILRLNDEIKNLSQSIEMETRVRSESGGSISDIEKENEKLASEIAKFESIIGTLKSERNEKAKTKSLKEKVNKDLLANAKSLEESLNNIRLEKIELTYKLESKSKELENLKDEIKPFISIDIEELESEIDIDESLKVSKTDLINLQKSINNIGYFTEDSLHEFTEAKDEFEFLDKQVKDLKESKSNIEEMIKALESQMKDEFKKNFDIINEKFARIFQTLFMGGEAKLMLDDEDELKAGVDIIARPPSKSLKSISLLSGGEKSLTAVALLFAIFETNPAPFAILDEIDAALDETNIKRYIEYLKNLSVGSQFIMITHRQTTMQLAEEIYGVTIGEDGVSKLYNIEFE